MNDYNIEDNLVQALTRAVDEGIRIGADLAAMHGSDATSQELEKAFFDGCEVGYKKASEELQPYIDLYKDLAEKTEKVARKAVDRYSKWIPVTERLPAYMENVLVTDGMFSGMGWRDWYDCRGTKPREDYWISPNTNVNDLGITHWMPLPEPPKEE